MAELDRVPARRRILGEVELLAIAMLKLLQHQSTPAVSSVTGCSTCSRVLTLEERDQAVLADQVLDGACAV